MFSVKAPNGIFTRREDVSEGGGLVPNAYRQQRRAPLFAAVSWRSDSGKHQTASATHQGEKWISGAKPQLLIKNTSESRFTLRTKGVCCCCTFTFCVLLTPHRIRGIESLNPAFRLNCHSSWVKAPLLKTHAGSFYEDNMKKWEIKFFFPHLSQCLCCLVRWRTASYFCAFLSYILELISRLHLVPDRRKSTELFK